MFVQCVAIFWVVNASSGEERCLQFSIPTGSGVGGNGGVSHRLGTVMATNANVNKVYSRCSASGGKTSNCQK